MPKGPPVSIWGWAHVPQSVLLCVFQAMAVQWEDRPGDWEVEDCHRAARGGGQAQRAQRAFILLLLCAHLVVLTAAQAHRNHRRHAPNSAAKSLQSCLTLCDPIDSSPPGSAVPGILQARTLEWVAISFSIAWKWKVKVKSLSRDRHVATSWTVAHQAPPSMGFSRQGYWSGLPLPSPAPNSAYPKFPFMAPLVPTSAGQLGFLESCSWSLVPDSAGQA